MQNSDLNLTTEATETVDTRKAWHAPVVAVFNADEAENGGSTTPDAGTVS